MVYFLFLFLFFSYYLRTEIPLVLLSSSLSVNLPPSSTSVDTDLDSIKCVFWNEKNSDWDTDGCEVAEVRDTKVICACSHLTQFTVGKIVVSVNIVNPSNVSFFPSFPPKAHLLKFEITML